MANIEMMMGWRSIDGDGVEGNCVYICDEDL